MSSHPVIAFRMRDGLRREFQSKEELKNELNKRLLVRKIEELVTIRNDEYYLCRPNAVITLINNHPDGTQAVQRRVSYTIHGDENRTVKEKLVTVPLPLRKLLEVALRDGSTITTSGADVVYTDISYIDEANEQGMANEETAQDNVEDNFAQEDEQRDDVREGGEGEVGNGTEGGGGLEGVGGDVGGVGGNGGEEEGRDGGGEDKEGVDGNGEEHQVEGRDGGEEEDQVEGRDGNGEEDEVEGVDGNGEEEEGRDGDGDEEDGGDGNDMEEEGGGGEDKEDEVIICTAGDPQHADLVFEAFSLDIIYFGLRVLSLIISYIWIIFFVLSLGQQFYVSF
ncbi:hypothetical protein ACHAXS_002480 [Conticribra weissflogii]